MSQEKAAEIIDLNASREAPAAGAQPAGEFLASARRAAGLSLAAVSDATKIKIEHLEAIEASNADALPISAYSVGFVKAYARFLKLDEEGLATQFKKDIGADKPVAEIAPLPSAETPQIGEGARMASIFGIVAILVFVFWIVVKITSGPGDEDAARVTRAPEQRVRLGDAPLERPEPRLRAPEADASAAVTASPAVDETQPTSAPPEQVTTQDALSAAEAPLENSEEAPPENVQMEETASSVSDAATDVDDAPAATSMQDFVVAEPEASAPVVVTTPAPSPEIVEEPVEGRVVRAAPPPVREPVIVEARLVRSIAPNYPNRCARGADDLEMVTVRFDVSVAGRAENVRVVDTTNNCFNSSAVSTLRRWRFDPKTVDGAARADLAKQATLNFRR